MSPEKDPANKKLPVFLFSSISISKSTDPCSSTSLILTELMYFNLFKRRKDLVLLCFNR